MMDDEPTDLDYRAYLRWLISQSGRKQGEVADRAGRSAAWLSQILNNRRRLQPELAEDLAGALDLPERQRLQLLSLVEAEVGNSTLIRRRATDLLTGLGRREPAENTSAELRERLGHWRVGAILELASCQEYVPDPAWVAAPLRPRMTVGEARALMDDLRSVGALDASYGLVQPEAPGVGTERVGPDASKSADAQAETVRMAGYHRSTLELARGAIGGDPRERLFAGACIALSEDDFQTLQSRLEEMFAQILYSAQKSSPNRVFHVNLAAFPISLFSDSAVDPRQVDDEDPY
ncbi:MAG: TIGR02147 family protein [Myxococcota bacterium]